MMLDGNLDTGDLMTNDQGTWSNQITVSSICFWHIHFMMISFMKKFNMAFLYQNGTEKEQYFDL